MATDLQDIAVLTYQGPQGSFDLTLVETAGLNRTKSRSRVKTMNRARRGIGFQTGTEEITISMTVIPERGASSEVNWQKAWKDDEFFTLIFEKGVDGLREQAIDCIVADVNDTFNEAGEARQEISIEALQAIEEPAAA